VSPHEEIVEQIFQDVSNGKVHRAVAVTYTPHTPDQSLR
jgi:hypothetical protein